MAIIEFDSLMKRLLPYDEVQSKEDFLRLISVDYPELQEKLKQGLTVDNEWTKRVINGEQVYFNVYNTHWKKHIHCPVNRDIDLGYIENGNGEKKLVIKLNIY